jgi:hypothetical protein
MASRDFVAEAAKMLKKIAEKVDPECPARFSVTVKNYDARNQKGLSFYGDDGDKGMQLRVFIEMEKDTISTDHAEARLLTMDVRDFRKEGEAVILTHESVKLAVIREALTADPDFNLGTLPFLYVDVNHAVSPPSTSITLLLDRTAENTHGAPARVMKNCWDLALETICKMILNKLPGFEGTKMPLHMPIKKKKNDKGFVKKVSSVQDVETMEEEEEAPIKKKKKNDKGFAKKVSFVQDVETMEEEEAPVVLGYPVSVEHEGLPVVTGRPLLDN